MSAALPLPLPSFRPMTEADLGVVMDIEERCYPFPWTLGIYRDCLRVGYSCWVLELEGAVRGYGVMQLAAGEAHIMNLCIHPDFQRRGHGRAMLEHLVATGGAHGAEMVFLEVRPSNRSALSLYHGLGFGEVGLRRNYYPAEKGREDAIILARDLGVPG